MLKWFFGGRWRAYCQQRWTVQSRLELGPLFVAVFWLTNTKLHKTALQISHCSWYIPLDPQFVHVYKPIRFVKSSPHDDVTCRSVFCGSFLKCPQKIGPRCTEIRPGSLSAGCHARAADVVQRRPCQQLGLAVPRGSGGVGAEKPWGDLRGTEGICLKDGIENLNKHRLTMIRKQYMMELLSIEWDLTY